MKLIVVGLDGATFDLIKPWIEKEHLPTFKTLMEGGIYGDLLSTIPPVTSPAWPSFATGKNPGKHGIFDFLGEIEGYEREVKNAKDMKTETLWKILSDHGKTSIVFNVPVTYPPERIRGCIVSGMLTPPGVCYSYPEEISEILDKMGYRIRMAIKKTYSQEEILQSLTVQARKRFGAGLFLMKKFNWDFFMIVFRGTDIIQHYMWQFGKPAILKFYKEIDQLLAELLRQWGKNASIFLMSDHGFGPIYKAFHVNSFLKEIGLLKLEDKTDTGDYVKVTDYRSQRNLSKNLFMKLGLTKERVYNIAKKFSLIWILQKLYKFMDVTLPTTSKSIDWTRTKAFFASSIGPTSFIRINLKGREPKGVVEKEEYEITRNFIIRELMKIRDPETGEKIVDEVFKREEIYHGPYTKDAPDMVILTKDLKYRCTGRIYEGAVVSYPIHVGRGTHRMHGIFVAYGPDIKKTGGQLDGLRIIDLAPTILHMFDVAIPGDMDGKVLTQIFERKSRFARRAVKYQISHREKERIKEKIKRLRKDSRI